MATVITVSMLMISVYWSDAQRHAYACSLADPDWWWVERLAVPEQSLPDGLTLRASGSGPISPDNSAFGFFVSNAGTDPIYILTSNAQLELLERDQLITNSTIPIESYEDAILLEAEDERFLAIGPGLEPRQYRKPIELYAEPNFIDLNVRADHRSGSPPSPQYSYLAVVAGDSLTLVAIELTYLPNLDYHPTRYEDSFEFCEVVEATIEAEMVAYESTKDNAATQTADERNIAVAQTPNAVTHAPRNTSSTEGASLFRSWAAYGIIISILVIGASIMILRKIR